jgi:CRP-like cAMP-binding protein
MDKNTLINFRNTIRQLAEPIVENFSDDQIFDFISKTSKKIYKTNDFFSTSISPNRSIAYIAKGLFRLYMIDRDGNEATHDFTGDGMFMAPYSAITLNVLAPVYIQALEESEVYAMSRDEFMTYWENDIRWKNVLQKYNEYDCLELRYREMELLLYDASERYTHFLEYFKKYEGRIKLRYIASYLGISPETLSRIRNKN